MTVSLFGEAKFKEAFDEMIDVVKRLTGKYSSSEFEPHLAEILLNRGEIRLRNWTPIHHSLFGAVFELDTYKDQDAFLLEKCERYLSFLSDKLWKDKKGVKGLKKDLRNFENFQKGTFFEMEADVLLAKITNPPQEFRKKVRANAKDDVDFVGNWNGKVINFEIKSLTESPKYLAKGSEEINGNKVGWKLFLHDRSNRIKDMLVYDTIKKFESGANNFVVIADADLLPTKSEELKCTIRDLLASDLGISKYILAVIMYRTSLCIEKPENQRAIIARVAACPPWVNDFFQAFQSAVA